MLVRPPPAAWLATDERDFRTRKSWRSRGRWQPPSGCRDGQVENASLNKSSSGLGKRRRRRRHRQSPPLSQCCEGARAASRLASAAARDCGGVQRVPPADRPPITDNHVAAGKLILAQRRSSRGTPSRRFSTALKGSAAWTCPTSVVVVVRPRCWQDPLAGLDLASDAQVAEGASTPM